MAEILGMDFGPIDDSVVPISAVIVIKALDEDGDMSYMLRTTEKLTNVEALGMARFLTLGLENAIVEAQYESEDEEED